MSATTELQISIQFAFKLRKLNICVMQLRIPWQQWRLFYSTT